MAFWCAHAKTKVYQLTCRVKKNKKPNKPGVREQQQIESLNYKQFVACLHAPKKQQHQNKLLNRRQMFTHCNVSATITARSFLASLYRVYSSIVCSVGIVLAQIEFVSIRCSHHRYSLYAWNGIDRVGRTRCSVGETEREQAKNNFIENRRVVFVY